MLKLESKKINDEMEYVKIKEENSNIIIMLENNNIHIIKYKNEEELLERYLDKIGNENKLTKELKDLEIENEILRSEIDCLYEELDEGEEEFYDVDYSECEHSEDCVICEEIRKLREEKEKEKDEI